MFLGGPCRHAFRQAAQTVAVATPCWPAPVSAIESVLALRRASRGLVQARCLILWGHGVVEVFALQQRRGPPSGLGSGAVSRLRFKSGWAGPRRLRSEL